jgi:hypothetical protein
MSYGEPEKPKHGKREIDLNRADPNVDKKFKLQSDIVA